MPVNALAVGLVSMIDSTQDLSRIRFVDARAAGEPRIGRRRGVARSDRRSERDCPGRSDRPDYSTGETRNGNAWSVIFPGGKAFALDLLTQLFCWFDGLSVM